MSIIINAAALQRKLAEPNLVMIDVRSKDKNFPTGEAAYKHSHLPGAVYLDLKKDLSGDGAFLPNVDALAKKLSSFGISPETEVVIYDEGNHRAASKAWFVLEYIGHKQMKILNGGFPAWIRAGGEVTADIPQRAFVDYPIHPQPEMVLTIEEIKERIQDEESVLIDSRSYERYTGEVEPKYKKAGHIPGAVNYHTKHVFNEAGQWKQPSELSEHFSKLNEEKEIIVSCGSGGSACMNLVALKEAGFEHVKIYPGGFSEWIEEEENEVKQGDESQE